MRVKARIALAGIVVTLMASGCRVKGFESFKSATTPTEFKDQYVGDKYSNGGIADATGGVKPDAQYGAGAKKGAGVVMNTQYDQPAKGTGNQPGENSGTGKGNGPVMQPEAGTQNATNGLVKG